MKLKVKEDSMYIIPETPQDNAFLKLHFGIGGFGDKITGELRAHFEYPNSDAIKFESTTKEEK